MNATQAQRIAWTLAALLLPAACSRTLDLGFFPVAPGSDSDGSADHATLPVAGADPPADAGPDGAALVDGAALPHDAPAADQRDGGPIAWDTSAAPDVAPDLPGARDAPAPGPRGWTSAAPMKHARFEHAAARLANGKVLVLGGEPSAAELYDPATDSWWDAGSISDGRSYNTVTPLGNGRALVVGGSTDTELKSPELYDPATNGWSSAGSLRSVHFFHTATLLDTGKVLILEGSTVDLYDPVSNRWSPGAPPLRGSGAHTATLIGSKVLVAGGAETYAQIYDPAADRWLPARAMTASRAWATATLLPSGRVLVVGGSTGGSKVDTSVLETAELYDPATDEWSPAASLKRGRASHTATLLANGEVLVIGGNTGYFGLASAELYDPVTNTWSPAGSMEQDRFAHTATLLDNGDVLVTGGFALTNVVRLSSAELYGTTGAGASGPR